MSQPKWAFSSLSLSHSSYILISHILSRFLHIQKTFFIKKNSLSHAPFLVCTSLSSKYEIMFGQLLQTFGEFLLVTLFLTHTYQLTLYLQLALMIPFPNILSHWLLLIKLLRHAEVGPLTLYSTLSLSLSLFLWPIL